jgi:hypothetical protein
MSDQLSWETPSFGFMSLIARGVRPRLHSLDITWRHRRDVFPSWTSPVRIRSAAPTNQGLTAAPVGPWSFRVPIGCPSLFPNVAKLGSDDLGWTAVVRPDAAGYTARSRGLSLPALVRPHGVLVRARRANLTAVVAQLSAPWTFMAPSRSDCRPRTPLGLGTPMATTGFRDVVAAVSSAAAAHSEPSRCWRKAVVSPAALAAAERDTKPSSPTEYRGTGVVLARGRQRRRAHWVHAERDAGRAAGGGDRAEAIASGAVMIGLRPRRERRPLLPALEKDHPDLCRDGPSRSSDRAASSRAPSTHARF